jgi:two-component system sensor histidine kinase RpfC
MIDGFKTDVDESVTALRKSVEDSDPAQFRFAAHAIKSCSNNVGAAILASICGKLEKITEPEFKDRGHEYVRKIEQLLIDATQELNSFLVVNGAQTAIYSL